MIFRIVLGGGGRERIGWYMGSYCRLGLLLFVRGFLKGSYFFVVNLYYERGYTLLVSYVSVIIDFLLDG